MSKAPAVSSDAVLKIAQAITELITTSAPEAEDVPTARFVKVSLASKKTGFTPIAIRRKMDRGDWVEGLEYRVAPDGERLVDMEGYERWVLRGKGKKTGSKSGTKASGSSSSPKTESDTNQP